MDIWAMKEKIGEARSTLKAADKVAGDIAPLLIGRLRHCNSWELKKLKKELAEFNMHTLQWKDQ